MVTVIGPDVTFGGTARVIVDVLTVEISTVAPLILTMLFSGFGSKLVPLIVTPAPAAPDGVIEEIVGAEPEEILL